MKKVPRRDIPRPIEKRKTKPKILDAQDIFDLEKLFFGFFLKN